MTFTRPYLVPGVAGTDLPQNAYPASMQRRARLFGDDTHPEIERLMVEGYRRMPPAEKMARLCDLNRAVTALALAGVKQRDPTISDDEARWRVAELRYGRDLVSRVRGHLAGRDVR